MEEPRSDRPPSSAAGPRLPAERPWHVAMAALALGLALASSPYGVALAVATGAGVALAGLGARRLGLLAAALLVVGAGLGQLRLAALDAPADRVRDGARLSARAWVLAPPRPGPYGSAVDVEVQSGRLRGARLLVRAPLWTPIPAGLRSGREVWLTGGLQALRPAGTNDFDDYLRRRGVAGELALERMRATGRRRGGPAAVLDALRGRAERAVAAGMPAPEGALLRGMVLGQDEAIDPATREDFRASGLGHLLAVSGQNVMLLAALAMPALLFAGAGPHARLGLLAALIAIYVPLAGAGPSLQRAGVMGLAGLAAIGLSRPGSRWYALLLAAVVTLGANPRSIGDPGWQLSFAAVAGILVLGVPLGRGLARVATELLPGAEGWTRAALRAAADGVAITVAATLATAPLLAHHFGFVPLAGLPANVLALPAVAPAMWLGMVKTALGQLPVPGAAEALGTPAAVAVRYLGWLAERFADARWGRLAVRIDAWPGLPIAYAALIAGIWGAGLRVRRLGLGEPSERAARWRRLPRARRVAVVLALALALGAAGATALDRPDAPERLTVRFLDVGQGDATLIQHPDGSAVLFDGGPPEAGVARLLRRAGVSRLDAVVATHASRDHHGGLLDVMRRFAVSALLDGSDARPDPGIRALRREAAARAVPVVPAVAPLALTFAGGDLSVEVLSPPPRPPGPPPEDPNPRAVVAVVRSGAFELLLSADAESEALLPLDLPDVDAMKVPHHGSADPGLPEVLARLRPELAVIEVGENTYGHPAPSTLAALRRAGVPTYRTDEDGTVSLSVDAGGAVVGTER